MFNKLSLGVFLVAVVLGCKFASTNTATEPGHDPAPAANPSINSNENVVKTLPSPTPAPKAANEVCSDPAKPCGHKDKTFDAWELSFKLPPKLTPNKTYKSAPFYALILKTYKLEDDCDGGEYIEAVETERKELQKSHPGRKVFASYECPNLSAVDYDFSGKMDAKRERVLIDNFLAIYAGETQAEAEQLLENLKTKYPDAAMKEMTATYEMIVQ